MSNESVEYITHNDLKFIKLQSPRAVDIGDLYDIDGVIIEYSNQQTVLELIRTIRSHEDEAIYLLPIFLNKFFREPSQQIAHFADGTLSEISDLSEIAETTHQIKDRL